MKVYVIIRSESNEFFGVFDKLELAQKVLDDLIFNEKYEGFYEDMEIIACQLNNDEGIIGWEYLLANGKFEPVFRYIDEAE